MQKSFTALILLISLAVTGVGCGGFTCKDAERGRELDKDLGTAIVNGNKSEALKIHKEMIDIAAKYPTSGTLKCTIDGKEHELKFTQEIHDTLKKNLETKKKQIDALP